MYPEPMIAPMREELTRFGVNETRTAAEVEKAVNSGGTLMLVVNSFADAPRERCVLRLGAPCSIRLCRKRRSQFSPDRTAMPLKKPVDTSLAISLRLRASNPARRQVGLHDGEISDRIPRCRCHRCRSHSGF